MQAEAVPASAHDPARAGGREAATFVDAAVESCREGGLTLTPSGGKSRR